jgi:heat shock protein HtpX
MLRALFFTGGRRSRRSGGGGGGLVIVVALVAAILAPIMAQLIYFACSRKREYLADACGARFTRYPEGLASALEKIQHHALRDRGSREVNRIVAPMYIINPRALTRKAASLMSTHPETARRIEILRAMGGGAGYSDYETAYSRVTQGKLLDEKVLDSSDRVAVREPSAEPEQSAAEKTRSAVDILHKLEGMLFLSCACGLRMKAPKNYQGKHIQCPRCGTEHLVPIMAAGAALEAAADAMEGGSSSSQSVTPPLPEKPQEVTLSGGGWQSVECRCGRSIQVSPSFMANRIDCRDCGRVIRIKRG